MEDHISFMDKLFNLPAYSDNDEQNFLFLEALQQELIFHYDNNEQYRQFCNKKDFNPRNEIRNLADIPPVAVSVFKDLGMNLASVPLDDIKLRLQSSATSGTPSTIVVDKITARRQSKAMVKVIQEAIGKERRPFLVMDIDPRSEFRALLGARFAAITGYLNFASKAGFFLKAKNGVSYFDVEAMQEYMATVPKDKPVVIFGFTYILYNNVLKAIRKKGISIPLPKGSKVIHIGGWKKLESEKISKDLFNKQLAECFGITPIDIIDIYGFTEQMGLNYPDCPCGCKHESSYVKVLVRDIVTNKILPAGKEGKLEFITPIPHSYPGNVVLTDDLGMVIKGQCPYGRPGTRFKVLGRLKKAEIRGCGDILSNKLIFKKHSSSITDDTGNLDIQFFTHQLPENQNQENTLEYIINTLRHELGWIREQPIDALIGIIDAAAKKWATDPKYFELKNKGLHFLSSWCSEKHLREIASFGLRGNIEYANKYCSFLGHENQLLKANSKGLCCHWLAGNVQILGIFALVQCIMTKNVNLMKVSSQDDGVFTKLLSAFEGLTYTTQDGYSIAGDDLLKTIGVVYFSRNSVKLGELLSKNADVRIAWGGREAVETVAGFPSRYDSETVIFGPKLSFAVVTKEMLSDEQTVKKLAHRISIDVSLFDQSGCASAHNLFIEKGGAISPDRFCELLDSSMRKTEIQIPKQAMSPEQISAVHSIRGVYDFCGQVIGSDTMSYSILLDDRDELHKPIYSRVLFVHTVDSIMQAVKHINEDIQTIGIEATKEQAIAFAEAATPKGAVRFPKIGRMLNFEMPWDGIVLIDRLVKWNTLFGPLV